MPQNGWIAVRAFRNPKDPQLRFLFKHARTKDLYAVIKLFDKTEVPVTFKLWFTKLLDKTTSQWSTLPGTATPEEWARARKALAKFTMIIRHTLLDVDMSALNAKADSAPPKEKKS